MEIDDNDPLKYLPLIGIGVVAVTVLVWMASDYWISHANMSRIKEKQIQRAVLVQANVKSVSDGTLRTSSIKELR